MQKYFCDRCEKEIPVDKRVYLQFRNSDGDLNGEMLLCADCVKSLDQWKENKDGVNRV